MCSRGEELFRSCFILPSEELMASRKITTFFKPAKAAKESIQSSEESTSSAEHDCG